MVADPKTKPPHKPRAKDEPIPGITEIKLVMTVPPQKLIWPQGKRYPKKAVKITKINNTMPVRISGGCLIKEPDNQALCRWAKIKMKKKEDPLE